MALSGGWYSVGVVGLIRSLFILVVLGGLAYFGATVELGQRTFFGHVARIWTTDETQDLVEGVKESGAPVMERIKRGVQAGLEEARRPAPEDAPTGDLPLPDEEAPEHSDGR